ncbi:hypothetical protein C2E31_01275 [Rhodopirellula baltica]|nr:hypothetical protein C2E31_01275 [Rhodopirellula baltica]
MSELDLLQRKLVRETNARKEAESLLEQKSRNLYEANQQLRALATIPARSSKRLRKESSPIAMEELFGRSTDPHVESLESTMRSAKTFERYFNSTKIRRVECSERTSTGH